jgi:hypothetical protein
MKNKKWERERESERGELKKKCMGEGKGDRGRARFKK